jgi:DNA topoisomerase-3
MVATLVDEVRSESRQANISHAGSAQKKLQSREKKVIGILAEPA